MKTNLESLLKDIQSIQKEIENNPNNMELYERYNTILQQLDELDSYIFDLEEEVYSDLIWRKEYRDKNPDCEAFLIDFEDIYIDQYQGYWEYGFDRLFDRNIYDKDEGLDAYTKALYCAIQALVSGGQSYGSELGAFKVLVSEDDTKERIKQLTKVKFIQVEIYILQANLAFQSKHYSEAIKYLQSAISENTGKTNSRITDIYTKVLDVLKEEQPQEYIKELAVYKSVSGLSSLDS